MNPGTVSVKDDIGVENSVIISETSPLDNLIAEIADSN